MKFTVKPAIAALFLCALALRPAAADMPPQPDAAPGFSSSSGTPAQDGFAAPAEVPAPAPADVSATKNISVHGESIALPKLEGFREIYGAYPTFDRLMLQFVPPTNSLQAFYISEDDFKALRTNPKQGFQNYMMVQTLAQDMRIRDESDFEELKSEVKSGLKGDNAQANKLAQQTLDNASDYLNEQYHKDAQLKMGEMRAIGTPTDDDNALSMLVLANYAVNMGQGTRGYPMVMSLNVLNVNGLPVFFFAYHSYKSPSDADLVSRVAALYRHRLFALNGIADAGGETVAAPAAEENGAAPVARQASGGKSFLPDVASDGESFKWLNMLIIGVAGIILLALLVTVFGGNKKLKEVIFGRKDEEIL
ncbi:MAG: hypothetical protein GC185_03525 [Alphaproteobacteria bacterium]|nr:hypothetical protein [Alphaproteobacteria bacterium]